MNFLVNYFKRSVEASGNQAHIDEMNAKISKWESRLEYTAEEGFTMASKEAVVEGTVQGTTQAVEQDQVLELVEEYVEERAKTAKEIKKQAYLSAAQLRKAIKKNPSKSNLKQLADLEAFIAEFYILTDLGIILKTQELQSTYK